MNDSNLDLPPWLQGVRGEQVLPTITSDERVIRVEAGPGTGKTFGLVRRVQRLLHPEGLNLDGQNILVVAFNRVIAKQLEKEIVAGLAQVPHRGEPVIKTAHALCLGFVGQELRIILPHERDAMLYDVLTEFPVIKERLDFRKAEKALAKHEAGIADDFPLWQACDQWLRRHNARLISDLPRLLREKLHGGEYGDRKYQHVIVDEFQDLTPGLQNLLLSLRSDSGHFMALGDPRQSIYAFLGNDPVGLSKIDKLVAPEIVCDLTMTECQRCPEDIVYAANQLTGLSNSLPMVPVNFTKGNIHLVVWGTVPDESKGMAHAIFRNIADNPDDSHLVMVTRRQFGYMLRDEITKLNSDLKIDLSFSESLLETWPVREGFLLFCLLVDADAPTWRAWFSYQHSPDGKEYNATARNSGAYLRFLSECDDVINCEKVIVMANGEKKPPGSGGKNLWERARRFRDLEAVINWDGINVNRLIDISFETSRWAEVAPDLKDTVLIDLELARAKIREILADIASKYVDFPPGEAMQAVARVLRYQIATKEPFASEEEADLRIMTLWGAKGVTADHVYVMGLCEEAMPGERRDEYPGTDAEYYEEQRRLFYVSITRAKKTMVLSRAKRVERQMARDLGLAVADYGFWPELAMCPFLRDIVNFLPQAIDGEVWDGCLQ